VARAKRSPTITIRPAALADVAAIHEIECASFGDPWSVASFRSMLAQPQVLASVAVRGDVVIGYSIAWQLADEAELANLAVAPGARGEGIGSALLDDLLRVIETRGGATVYLEVRESNAAARALYHSRAFEEVGRRKGYYDKPREDAVILRRASPV
jgi:[ribosomal protein S18]-alanine N-acetyltransferase